MVIEKQAYKSSRHCTILLLGFSQVLFSLNVLGFVLQSRPRKRSGRLFYCIRSPGLLTKKFNVLGLLVIKA